MCAVDAFGIAFMVGRSATVHASEPETGTAVEVAVDPASGAVGARASSAVAVVAGNGNGARASCACPYINVFAAPEAARRYLAGASGLLGEVVSLEQAAEAGRVLFGELMGGAPSNSPAPPGECC